MKMLNYDARTLILMNVKSAERQPVPDTYTKAQLRILRELIARKRIEKRFFDFVVSGLFDKSDWKTLDYNEMYLLIHVLAHYNYSDKKERASHE